MGSSRSHRELLFSLDTIPTYMALECLSPSFRASKALKYLPKQELGLYQSKSQNSLKYLKLAPINPLGENAGINAKVSDSVRRRNLVRGVAPMIIPKNLVARCAFQSQTGKSDGCEKPHNQDSLLCVPKLNGVSHQFLLGVFDGHGEYGHEISFLIKQTLLSQILHCPSKSSEYELEEYLERIINYTSHTVLSSDIEASRSGSTLCLALLSGNYLICGNIGDSRCVIGRYERFWESIDISIDHKPSFPSEAERIKEAGGVISNSNDKSIQSSGPMRVWAPHGETYGIAMSRSVGDKFAKSFGVTSQCDIFSRRLDQNDKFIVIASDGVWDMLSSQEVVNIVSKGFLAKKSEIACKELVQEATKRWNSNGDDVDDISVIVMFFKG